MVYRNSYVLRDHRDAASGSFPIPNPADDRREDTQAAPRFPLATYEWEIVDRRGYFDLDPETVEKYRMLFRLASPDHEWLGLDKHEFLARVGALEPIGDGRYALTAAGLLMFGRERDIVHVFPSYFLDCRIENGGAGAWMDVPARWKSRFTSQDGDWSGNLLDFYHRAFGAIVQDFPATVVDRDRPDRDEALRAARTAVKEALVNALVNADFTSYGGVTVTKSPYSIEISNPGHLGVDPDLALEGGVTNPFNKVIARMFALAGLCDRAGYGLPSIYVGWNRLGMPGPTIEELPRIDRVRLVLPLGEPSPIVPFAAKDEESATPAIEETDLTEPDSLHAEKASVPVDGALVEELPLREQIPYPVEEDLLDQPEEKPRKREKREKSKGKDKDGKKRLRVKKDGAKESKQRKRGDRKKLRLKDLEKIKPGKKKSGKKRKKKDRKGPMPDDIVAEVRGRLREQVEEPIAATEPEQKVEPETEETEQTTTGHGAFMYHGHQLIWGDSGDPMD